MTSKGPHSLVESRVHSTGVVAGAQRYVAYEDDPLVGRTLGGRYRISAYLMSGATSRVYRGMDEVLAVPATLKLVPHTGSGTAARLHDEARLMRRVHHRGVAAVFDWGVSEGIAYMAMERHGTSLAALRRPLESWRAATITRQIAEALATVHERGVVHRDVRPSNIVMMQDAEGREHAKLIDFGNAGLREGDELYTSAGSRQQRPGRTMAIASSTAKLEQMTLDPRYDIFSLGLVLYLLMSPRSPNEAQLWRRDGVNAELRHVVARLPGLPPASRFRQIILRCMDHAWDHRSGVRYQRAADLADDLAAHCAPR